MKKAFVVIRVLLTGMFLLCAAGSGTHFTSLLFLLASFLILPIHTVEEHLKKWKCDRGFLIFISIFLFILGVILSPMAKGGTAPLLPSEKEQLLVTEEKDSIVKTEKTKTEEFTAEEEQEEQEEETLFVSAQEKVPEKESEEQDQATEKEQKKSDSSCSLPSSSEEIPPYNGELYVFLGDGIPSFSVEELIAVGYERYSPLDSLGRCGVALASCGKELMPQEGEKRGSISSIKPSGWVQAQYDHVSGKYLYNRCHLIGWQLSAENANACNLITGTRFFNTEGMLLFENMIADYIKETGNHVAYRVSPIYSGNNLVANGVRLEAYSVEDEGDGICFDVFVYNIQPGVVIDYATGQSHLGTAVPSATEAPVTTTSIPPVTTQITTITQAPVDVAVYKTPSGKRYHLDPECGGENSTATTLSAAQSLELTPCQKCVK